MTNYDMLSNGLCVNCDITNCNKCSANNVCLQCSNSTGTTLYVNADRSSCVECSNANCAYRSSNNKCDVCDNNSEVSFSADSFKSHNAKLAPRALNSRASARPMPEPAPVMMQTLLGSRIGKMGIGGAYSYRALVEARIYAAG